MGWGWGRGTEAEEVHNGGDWHLRLCASCIMPAHFDCVAHAHAHTHARTRRHARCGSVLARNNRMLTCRYTYKLARPRLP